MPDVHVRRNLIPNPGPVGLDGWVGTEANATRTTLATAAPSIDTRGPIAYSATATGPGAQAGVMWNDHTQITVRAGERYGITVTDLDVTSLPDEGALRIVVLWFDTASIPVAGTVFGPALAVGTYDDTDPATRVIATAPATAAHATVAVLWNGDDTTAPVSFTVGRVLLEPLGPPQPSVPGAITNLATAPTLGHCLPGDPAGGATGGDGWPDGTGWVEHVGGAQGSVTWKIDETWSATGRPGSASRRATITTGMVTLPGTIYKGFVGSYVLPVGEAGYPCTEGDTYGLAATVNVLAAGPVGDPGCWLEMVWYFYDGDPAHTTVIRHDNSDDLLTPGAVELGARGLSMARTCPAGATIMQPVIVLASSQPGTLLDFYADQVLVTPLADDAPIPGWFDGDTPGAGWDGIPGYSTSRTPGRDARIPGPWFDGHTPGAHWDGRPLASMSTHRAGRRDTIHPTAAGPADPHLIDILTALP